MGRGRTFSKDREPLQYKPVIVTEYVMVYRKHTDRLIDWNIRKHGKDVIEASKVKGDYEATNVWRIPPARSKDHPAIFPDRLAENIVRYYSFLGDTVMDPFGGLGTTARAAEMLGRRFIYIEREKKYHDAFLKQAIMQNTNFFEI
jgi:DNA modification methylase